LLSGASPQERALEAEQLLARVRSIWPLPSA
jgi:hypothetical protein